MFKVNNKDTKRRQILAFVNKKYSRAILIDFVLVFLMLV